MDLLPGWYLPGLLHPDRPVHQLPHCPPQGSAPGGVVQQLVLLCSRGISSTTCLQLQAHQPFFQAFFSSYEEWGQTATDCRHILNTVNSWIPQAYMDIWWLLTSVFLSVSPSINLPALRTLFNRCFTSLPPFLILKCLRQSQCSWLLTDQELSQFCKNQLYIYVLLYFWLQHMTILSYLLVDIILSS